jgi:hypothetical protein
VIVEVITFRPHDASYIDLEARIYAAMCVKPGFMRRTTARTGDEWCVVQLWDSPADAEAGWDEDFANAVDVVSVKRYEDLGG